jgi:hypothetical protein
MEPHLIDTGDVNEDTGSRGRPARLFRRRRDRG